MMRQHRSTVGTSGGSWFCVGMVWLVADLLVGLAGFAVMDTHVGLVVLVIGVAVVTGSLCVGVVCW